MIKYKMNKHSEPLFQKSNFSHTPGMIRFSNFFITPPKTFQLSLGVAGKEVLTLSALSRSCQFLPLSDPTIVKHYEKNVVWYTAVICDQNKFAFQSVKIFKAGANLIAI